MKCLPFGEDSAMKQSLVSLVIANLVLDCCDSLSDCNILYTFALLFVVILFFLGWRSSTSGSSNSSSACLYWQKWYCALVDAIFHVSFHAISMSDGKKPDHLLLVYSKMWPDLGKPTFWAQANLWENSIKNFYNVLKLSLFHIWIKQLLHLLALKFHTKSFFFLGDMDDYIRSTDVPKR